MLRTNSNGRHDSFVRSLRLCASSSLSVRTFVRPSVRPTVRSSDRLTVRSSVRPAVRPSVRLPSVRPFDRPFARPSVLPSVRSSVCPSCSPSVRPSVRPFVLPSVRPSCHPSVRPFIRLSASRKQYIHVRVILATFARLAATRSSPDAKNNRTGGRIRASVDVARSKIKTISTKTITTIKASAQKHCGFTSQGRASR